MDFNYKIQEHEDFYKIIGCDILSSVSKKLNKIG